MENMIEDEAELTDDLTKIANDLGATLIKDD
jgi:hypothetical protein